LRSAANAVLLPLSCYYFSFPFAQQYNFNEVDNWLKENLNQLGGRAVLVIVRDGKMIYKNAENDLSPKQKMVVKFIAKRQCKNHEDFLKDYSFTTKTAIASCSKWLSAALVMTFVDEK